MKAPLASTWASHWHGRNFTHVHKYVSTPKEGTTVTFGEPEKQNKSVSAVSRREETETASCITDTLQIEQ